MAGDLDENANRFYLDKRRSSGRNLGSREDDIDILSLAREDDGLIDRLIKLVDADGDCSFKRNFRKTNNLDAARCRDGVECSASGVFLHDADCRLIDQNAASFRVQCSIGKEGGAFADEDGDILAGCDLKTTTRDEGEGTFDSDDIGDVEREAIKRDLKEGFLTHSKQHGNLTRTKANDLVHRFASIINADKDGRSGIDSRKGYIDFTLHHSGDTRWEDDQGTAAIAEGCVAVIFFNRCADIAHREASHAACLIEEEVATEAGCGNAYGESSESKASIKKRDTEVRTAGKSEHFRSGSKVELARNFLRAGVELHANLARAERDTRNIEGEGLDAEATDDPVLIDIEVPCPTAYSYDSASDVKFNI